eukprot:2551118-Karenia_brevis.AAC.1
MIVTFQDDRPMHAPVVEEEADAEEQPIFGHQQGPDPIDIIDEDAPYDEPEPIEKELQVPGYEEQEPPVDSAMQSETVQSLVHLEDAEKL